MEQEELFRLFKFIDKEARLDLQKRLSEYGLTAQQGRLLFFIACRQDNGVRTKQVDIENHFQLTKSTVHGLISRMEKADLVQKTKEGNSCYLVPTKYAESIMTYVHDKRGELLDKMFKNISREELETLSKLLNRVLDNMKGGND